MNRPPPSVMPPTQQQQQQVQQTTSQPPPLSQSTYVEKIMVGLDHAPPTFDLRGQLIGAAGANLHYIRNETGAIATLRGRGSLFLDLTMGTESSEPMHLYIEHPRFDGLQSAKQLAKNLIETLQQELVHFQQLHPPNATNIQYAPQQQQTVLQSNQVSIKKSFSFIEKKQRKLIGRRNHNNNITHFSHFLIHQADVIFCMPKIQFFLFLIFVSSN